MIKNYFIKIISSVFIMLTIFMVSTSVFAISNISISSMDEFPVTMNDINQCLVDNGYSDYINSPRVIYRVGDYYYIKIILDNSQIAYLKEDTELAASANVFHFYNSSDSKVSSRVINLSMRVGKELTFSGLSASSNYVMFASASPRILYYSDFNMYHSDGSIFYDTGVYNPAKIIYEVNYSEDNKTAILTAEIKNSRPDYKLYYSTLGYSITGKLMNPIELDQSQATVINLNKNIMIHLQALDSSGNIIDTVRSRCN